MKEFTSKMNATRNEQKQTNKKTHISTPIALQRSPNSKTNQNHSKNTKTTSLTMANALLNTQSPNKLDVKPSSTKTSRNQVSANWNSAAGSLKTHRHIPTTKKIG